MPTYVYQCRKCGEEIWVRATGIDNAPKCCGEKAKLIIQTATVIVKDGTGAYKDG